MRFPTPPHVPALVVLLTGENFHTLPISSVTLAGARVQQDLTHLVIQQGLPGHSSPGTENKALACAASSCLVIERSWVLRFKRARGQTKNVSQKTQPLADFLLEADESLCFCSTSYLCCLALIRAHGCPTDRSVKPTQAASMPFPARST